MEGIPSEILNQVFDLLSQEHHIECMLVCHLWKELIESHSLFRDLRIYSTDNLKFFVEKLQNNPTLGRNVKQLTCYFDNSTKVNLTKLLEPLCNLQTFECFGPEYGTLLIDNNMSFPWHTSIKSYKQRCFHPIINSVLETDVFPRLIVLDVCDNDDDESNDDNSSDEGDDEGNNEDAGDEDAGDEDAGGEDADDEDAGDEGAGDDRNNDDNDNNNSNNNSNNISNSLVDLLKNASALKDLTLRFSKIGFVKLDTLHESLTNLNTLTLKYSEFQGDTFYKYTAPAKSITEFNLLSVASGTVQQRIEVLQYIKIKYPNLVHLKLDPDFFGNSNSEIEQLNKQGWHPLLQNLGSQLKKLHVYYLHEVQSFLDMLDINRCQIQTLYLKAISPNTAFPNIQHSQQAQYIKTLVMQQTRPKSFDWLRELEVLESLEIGVDQYDEPLVLNFNDFVKNCPDSLISLSLNNVKITAQIINAIQCNLESLTLAYSILPQKMDWFISRHFPLLSAFTLKNCKFHAKKFDMKAIDLQTFCLIQNMNKDPITVLVRTYDDFEERWYSTRGVESYYPFMYQRRDIDPIKYPPAISLPAIDIKEKPFFTLYCHTMRQIFLCR